MLYHKVVKSAHVQPRETKSES